MLTPLFLAAVFVAPPPFPPTVGWVTAQPYSLDERMLVVIVFANWRGVPEGHQIRMEWNLNSPPGVFLVDCTLRPVPLRIFWSSPSQSEGVRVYPWRSHFQVELREVWLRDGWGRVLKKIPVNVGGPPVAR